MPRNRMDKIPGVNYLLPATVFHKATEVHKMCSIFYMHMYNTPSTLKWGNFQSWISKTAFVCGSPLTL